MAKTLAQIQKEISRLQQEADSLRQREVADVVARIQDAIAHYGLTADDLFGAARAVRAVRAARAGRAAAPAKKTRRAKSTPASKPASVPKYQDGKGNTWTGHGKRPTWFKAAIDGGQTPDELLIPR